MYHLLNESWPQLEGVVSPLLQQCASGKETPNFVLVLASGDGCQNKLNKTEPEQTATQCNQTVRCQPDHDNTEHICDHNHPHLHEYTEFFFELLLLFLNQFDEVDLYTLVE